MKSFVCVLKSGGDFTPKHVQILQRMVSTHIPSTDKFICYSDIKVPGVETIKLQLGLKGKYSMVEVFRHPGRVLVTGLDTIITKNIDHVWDLLNHSGPSDFWMIDSFNPNRTYANGVMGWNGDWSWMFDEFQDPKAYYDYRLEQQFTIKKLESDKANIKVFNKHLNIYSYKHHCKEKLPKDAEIVLFHGFPRPHNVNVEWVQRLYK